jgi:hypothetical protein
VSEAGSMTGTDYLHGHYRSCQGAIKHTEHLDRDESKGQQTDKTDSRACALSYDEET